MKSTSLYLDGETQASLQAIHQPLKLPSSSRWWDFVDVSSYQIIFFGSRDPAASLCSQGTIALKAIQGETSPTRRAIANKVKGESLPKRNLFSCPWRGLEDKTRSDNVQRIARKVTSLDAFASDEFRSLSSHSILLNELLDQLFSDDETLDLVCSLVNLGDLGISHRPF